MLNQVAVALDYSTEEEVKNFVSLLNPQPKVFKVGLELTSSLGVKNTLSLLSEIAPESKAFLDLKLHDIPNTVAKTIQAIKQFNQKNIGYITVHSLGGSKMLEKAQEAAQNEFSIVAVTVLTSLDRGSLSADFQFSPSLQIQDISNQLVQMAHSSGVEWFVASANEAKYLKSKFPNIKLITPGIRLENDSKDDQSRVSTPKQALSNGSDLLVVGRTLTKASNPCLVWNQIINSK